jgi:hypothetical protein
MKNQLLRLCGVAVSLWSKSEKNRKPTITKVWRPRLSCVVTLSLMLCVAPAAAGEQGGGPP